MAWKLLEPIKVGSKVWKNRMVMAPMEARLNTPEGGVTQTMIDYYAERARGGVAAIIVENTFVDDEASRSSLISSGLYSDHLIAGKNLLAEAIQENGARAILQLSHGGRQANAAATGKECVAPSAIPCKVTQRMPRALSIEEIAKIQDAFAEAARRAEMAGFDGVELHGAHGYLISSFLSPYVNKRTDEYGGSLENRSRFARETIAKVRAKTGKGFTVGFRMNGAEYVPGGLTIEEACEFAKLIEEGVDYIHVSVGNYETMETQITPMYIEPGILIPLAEAVKKSVHIPVIAVGGMDARLAEDTVALGKADLVAFGRALIADPELPKKVAEGRLEDIRPCCRGNEGCISRFFRGCAIRCEVNPACGREREYDIQRTEKPRKVLIVGGGPAGMEAARAASLMGHDVTLLEKSGELGGHLIEGSVADFKRKTGALLNWLERQLEKSTVKIKRNTEATPELIRKYKPEVLILAVGSKYMKPPFPGAETALLPDAAMLERDTLGENIIIVGGGFIGAETALTLAEDGTKNVSLIEMQEDIVPEHEPISRGALKKRLAECGVAIYTSHTVTKIEGKTVTCRDGEGKEKQLAGDTIILATGLAADTDGTAKLQGLAPKTYIIGDCREARKVYNCFHEAWHAALNI